MEVIDIEDQCIDRILKMRLDLPDIFEEIVPGKKSRDCIFFRRTDQPCLLG